tara:strand:+ start:208 stop:606 length:399 start_codon:yes stop_codon:yes gene_type:complete
MPPKKSTKKSSSSRKGTASKTRPGDKNYTTKRGDADFHEGGKDVKKSRKPFPKKIKLEPTTAKLDGKTIKFMKGGLHKSLKVPEAYTFTRPTMKRLDKHENGKTFRFQGNTIKMTPKIHKQLVLGMNLMGKK